MGLLKAITKPFKAVAHAVGDVVEAGGKALNSVKGIPVVGKALSTLLAANPVTGPFVTALNAARAGVQLLKGGDVGDAFALAGGALGALGAPAGIVDAAKGVSGIAKAVSAKDPVRALTAAADLAGVPVPAPARQVIDLASRPPTSLADLDRLRRALEGARAASAR